MLSTSSDRPRRAAPGHPLARLAAGAFAGLVGGLAFGVLMAAPALDGSLDGAGMMTLLGRALGTDSLPILWGVHLLNSALFGALFGLAVRPGGTPRTTGLGMAWGALLWLLGSFLALRMLTGEPLAWGLAVGYNLLGHLAYGAVLGAMYNAVFREELAVLRDHPRIARRRVAP